MKHTTLAAILVPLAFAAARADEKSAETKHTHDHHEAGPNGGRVIESVEPHLEFFVTEDRRVRITILDEDLKPVAPGDQTVSLIGGDRANPTRMKFTVKDGAFVSDIAFPEGNNLPIVLQIKTARDARTVIEKFNLNLDQCPTCQFREYACVCEHDHDHDEKGRKKGADN
ncbi:MAG: hypothetical protein H7A53_11900 [Akkermansiaceae bacterium]|nr:hypothetical protein [Akkermansiaceae bacterium]MCP5551583.1 hypothetical protein [Akkermansiaceae bacterium]